MRPDLVIAYSPVGGGHKAAAAALAEAAARRGLSTVVLDTFENAPRVFGQGYLAAHLAWQATAPELYGKAYFGANRRDLPLDPVRRGLDSFAWAGLVRRVLDLDPRAVIATHHLPLVVLGRAREEGALHAPLVGVVTDYGMHAVWAERGTDALCVAGAGARKDAIGHGVAPASVHVTGIPVRSAFEAIADVRDPAAGDALRVLVTSGGFGIGPIEAAIRSFAGMPGVELTVVCGRAPNLVRSARRLVARLGIPAEIVGFERDMPARLAAAHLVVGKAGGLTVSEAMTAGRPMVIAGAVPGNETLNADLVVASGAGVVAEPSEVGAVARGLRDAGILAFMGRRARRLVLDRAADRVLDVALREVTARSVKTVA
ncbi:MAG TPA: glycosyltransferase [Polyangiaceae bacterium]|jgi:processive 1,2-diacylglycerol beta-glucosyltransferase|nr:glycosyltransferase [Polyangiaceae bacterium]